MDATNLAELYGLPLLDRARIEARLDEGISQGPGSGGPDRHTCLAGRRQPGREPSCDRHRRALVDGAFWFETGSRSRKGRNLARDPRCTLSLATNQFDLVVEGEARMVTDPTTVTAMAGHWASAGWPARVDDTRTALTAEFSAPSAGPPPWFVYRITAPAATALETKEPGGATRWHMR
jgi:hypothetical protein